MIRNTNRPRFSGAAALALAAVVAGSGTALAAGATAASAAPTAAAHHTSHHKEPAKTKAAKAKAAKARAAKARAAKARAARATAKAKATAKAEAKAEAKAKTRAQTRAQAKAEATAKAQAAATATTTTATATAVAKATATATVATPVKATATATVKATATATATATVKVKAAAPVPTSTLVMGARAKDTSFESMDSTIGPVSASRWFSPGSLPATFSRAYSGTAIGAKADVWSSFKDASDANLTAYVKAADPGTKMVLHHEPEGDYSNGAAYVSWFDKERAVIKAANPNMPVVHAAAGYQYRPKGFGADCSYVPKDADIYTIDTYRRTVDDMVPLAQDDRFQRWLSCIPAGKPIGITEYGRGIAPFTNEMNALRAENIAKDAAYLRSNPAGHKAVVWMYWWTTGSDGSNWRFTDQASIDAWKAAAQG